MNNIRAVKNIIDELLYIMTEKQKKKAVIVFISMIINSLLELLSVSVIYPFLDTMMDSANIANKWYAKPFLFFWPDISPAKILLCIGCIIIFVFVVKNVISLLCSYIQYSYSARFNRELSTLMLKSYLSRPYEFFVNTNSAVVIRGINGDTSAAYQVLLDGFEFFTSFLSALMIGIYLLYTDWIIALGAIALAGLCFLFIVLFFKKRMKIAGKQSIEISTKKYMYSYQAINGIKEISVMDRKKMFIDQYEETAKDAERITVINNFINACPDRILEGICISGFIGIACIRIAMGVDVVSFVSVLGTFALGAFKILPTISKMSSRINNIVYNQGRLNICYNNIKEARELENERSQVSLENVQKSQKKNSDDLIKFNSDICVNNISWKYKNSKGNVLDDLNMRINKGESVAIIGASGAGKTTFADVILGLFEPQKGSITMDGLDVYRMPHEWAKIIGYVPQSVFLIDDTIRANIAFGIPAEMVEEEKIIKAIEMAQLSDFVNELPQGINTIVGERGVKFSGGQRQRVAIARALYENPEILILDEATSALDSETESAVMEAIDSLIGSKTLIIIAHRLTTIKNCDKVYEIRNGKAIERDKDEVISNELLG